MIRSRTRHPKFLVVTSGLGYMISDRGVLYYIQNPSLRRGLLDAYVVKH